MPWVISRPIPERERSFKFLLPERYRNRLYFANSLRGRAVVLSKRANFIAQRALNAPAKVPVLCVVTTETVPAPSAK